MNALQALDKCVAIVVECSNVHVIAHTDQLGKFQEYINTVCLANVSPPAVYRISAYSYDLHQHLQL